MYTHVYMLYVHACVSMYVHVYAHVSEFFFDKRCEKQEIIV